MKHLGRGSSLRASLSEARRHSRIGSATKPSIQAGGRRGAAPRTLTVGSRRPPGWMSRRTTSSRVAGCSCASKARWGGAGSVMTCTQAGLSWAAPRWQRAGGLRPSRRSMRNSGCSRRHGCRPALARAPPPLLPRMLVPQHLQTTALQRRTSQKRAGGAAGRPHPRVHDEPARQLARPADLLAAGQRDGLAAKQHLLTCPAVPGEERRGHQCERGGQGFVRVLEGGG